MPMRPLIGVLAACLGTQAAAEPIDQDRWTDRREMVKLDNGQRLAVYEHGDPNGKPLILLHGFTDSSRSWTMLLPALAEFRVVIPDMRGHGASSKPECCYSVADYAFDLKLLMDEMDIERAAVAGHSLGSMIAMEFAGTHPELVEKLVLAAPTGKAPFTRDHWMAQGALAMKDPIDQGGEFINAWFGVDSVVKTPVDRDFLEHVFREGRALPAPVWRGVVGGLVELNVARHASAIEAPVLILVGGKDDLFDAPHQHAIRAAFPEATFVSFENLGHNLIWEQTDKVAPPMVEFLRR